MSRVGKKLVQLLSNVEVVLEDRMIMLRGPKGELKRTIPNGIGAKLVENYLVITRTSESRQARAMHGLVRALVANMMQGVTAGFSRQLEINGVGYRAEISGNKISLAVGLSHPV